MRSIALALTGLALTGCMSTARASSTAHVRADGSYSVGVRSAVDGTPSEVGPQELIGVYLPLGPFAIKGGLLWDGTPLVITPSAAQAAPMAAPQFVEVDEQYVEMEPVTRTRKVRKAVVPAPRAVDPCAPARQKAPGCEPVACVNGACSLTASR